MIAVVKKRLPHGSVPSFGVSDPTVRNILMRLNENILSQKDEISSLQAAVKELQKKVG